MILGLAASLLVLLATAGTAPAQSAPPDSEFDQYVPDIPGSKGDSPLSDVKKKAGDDGEGGGDPSVLPQGTAEELESQGPEGGVVAGLAEATAPKGKGGGSDGQKGNGRAAPAFVAGDAGDSLLGAVLDALTGAAPGGLGAALPLVLLAALAGGVWYALRRRRAAGRAPARSP